MKLGMIRSGCSEDDFNYVKGKGLDFIEVCLNFAKDAEGWLARKDEIKQLSVKHGMPILSCGRWNGDGGPLDATGKVKPYLLDEAKRTISACAELGCPIYHCGCNRVEGMSLFRNYEAAIGWFATLIDFAKPLLTGRTTVLVTHDPRDAEALGGEILRLREQGTGNREQE